MYVCVYVYVYRERERGRERERERGREREREREEERERESAVMMQRGFFPPGSSAAEQKGAQVFNCSAMIVPQPKNLETKENQPKSS